ncbi:TPA: hypothetical protein ACFM8G_001237 [Neisseria meningitidis]|nr:hypothetical protein [Neisseria meningitidis]MCV6652505.1 hypothetical protein [Neisseria meningitidis]MCV6654147.1 hypothetical protein [Neisseria meningitidis]MCV6661017.1 hypothetical protein [Neisseria meningitidis]MCV6673221.1 hypothetical protein [Neisseria meningitidis]MCV6675060.1 hypothetical protein [Neisseria meningitidis]
MFGFRRHFIFRRFFTVAGLPEAKGRGMPFAGAPEPRAGTMPLRP